MNLYVGTIGELVIIELFVVWIWFQVLLETMRDRNVFDRPSLTTYNKLFLTSLGLVLNAVAITGIMAIRFLELLDKPIPFLSLILICYIVLAFGNFMFILSSAIRSNMRLLKVFAAVTVIWTAIVFFFI